MKEILSMILIELYLDKIFVRFANLLIYKI